LGKANVSQFRTASNIPTEKFDSRGRGQVQTSIARAGGMLMPIM
jgi:hypothetical protein